MPRVGSYHLNMAGLGKGFFTTFGCILTFTYITLKLCSETNTNHNHVHISLKPNNAHPSSAANNSLCSRHSSHSLSLDLGSNRLAAPPSTAVWRLANLAFAFILISFLASISRLHRVQSAFGTNVGIYQIHVRFLIVFHALLVKGAVRMPRCRY
jgi:hypothetical protein